MTKPDRQRSVITARSMRPLSGLSQLSTWPTAQWFGSGYAHTSFSARQAIAWQRATLVSEMTDYIVYVGAIKDPSFKYSGEPECWRENVELLDELARGMDAMLRIMDFSDGTRSSTQVDWATWILEMPLEELKRWVGPRRSIDVSAWRPFMPGMSDEQIREQMGFDPRAKLDRLVPDRRYALVAVEGI